MATPLKYAKIETTVRCSFKKSAIGVASVVEERVVSGVEVDLSAERKVAAEVRVEMALPAEREAAAEIWVRPLKDMAV